MKIIQFKVVGNIVDKIMLLKIRHKKVDKNNSVKSTWCQVVHVNNPMKISTWTVFFMQNQLKVIDKKVVNRFCQWEVGNKKSSIQSSNQWKEANKKKWNIIIQ